MRMWWQKNALDQHGEHSARAWQSRANDPGAARADPKPRAGHAHCAFGLPFYATRPGRAPAGLSPVTPPERRDMPWILLLAAVVVVIVIVGVWN
jgi:hypothetical protein